MEKIEIESIRKLLHEYKKGCDHGKQNLTMQVSMLSERLGRTQEMHESMRTTVEKIDLKLSGALEKITESIAVMNVSLATNAANHKSNGYLIKWLMTICSGILVGVATGIVLFLVRKS